jgi:DNA-binding PadR family transcriptional regulator
MAPAVFHILIALADQPRHGYGIMLGDDERLRYYRLTRQGREAAQREMARISALLSQARVTSLRLKEG